jgi:hypothetical protein
MECQDIRRHIADYLAGSLPKHELEALRAHAAVCAACREDLAATEETWQQLGRIPSVTPNVPTMRVRFEEVLVRYQERSGGRWQRIALASLAAAALLLVGIGIGRRTAPPAGPPADTQLTTLRSEIAEMRRMLSLSLLQQQSAAARLEGVISTRQIPDPGGDVIAALLDTLMYDPNANVRLATIDALKRFMDHELVKRGTIDALPRQKSPLVQIALIEFVVESAGLESAAVLRTLSSDSTVAEPVRMRAAQALRQLGAKS